jgi:hypothetical protein
MKGANYETTHMQFSQASCYFIPLKSKYFLIILFSDTLTTCVLAVMREIKFYTHSQ